MLCLQRLLVIFLRGHLGTAGFIMNILDDIFLPEGIMDLYILAIGKDIAVHIINKNRIAQKRRCKIDQLLKGLSLRHF